MALWREEVRRWRSECASVIQVVLHHRCYDTKVRTTVNLDDDVLAGAERLKREQHIGLSEALNRLARAGLNAQGKAKAPFRQRTSKLGLRVDVSNVAEVLEILDGPSQP